MSRPDLPIRASFAIAVALVAATCGDALVEGISNAHVFWTGRYTDGSSADLLPVATLALVWLLVSAVLGAKRRLGGGEESLLRRSSRALSTKAILRLMPAILTIQLLALYAMETSEQALVYGHVLGGSLWLGGPPWFALTVHAALAVALAFAVCAIVNVCAKELAGAVRFALTLGRRDARGQAAACERAAFQAPIVVMLRAARRGERAPPALLQSV